MITYNLLTKSYTSSYVADITFSHGFVSRDSGDGRSLEMMFSYLNINQVIFKKIVKCEQIHSANIAFYESQTSKVVEIVPDCDGVFTKEKGVVLTLKTADCIPILYADIKNNMIGVTHNGWRGTLKQISRNMIEKMVEHGAKRNQIVVILGPGINSCCYDIKEERYYQFLEELESDYDAFLIRKGKRFLNLYKLNVELLRLAGIENNKIDFFPFCTVCQKDRFFSFRRDYKNHPEKFGEMLSYIVQN